jgi:hypothetical protein
MELLKFCGVNPISIKLGYLNWIAINAMCPGRMLGRFDSAKRLPDCTVAFEATSKTNLPHLVAFLDPALGFSVG